MSVLETAVLANGGSGGETHQPQNDNENGGTIKSTLRDYDDHYKLYVQHSLPTSIYDHYMDLKPSYVQSVHAFSIELNKFTRFVFIIFLFYHSIWWSAASNATHQHQHHHQALLYSLIDKKHLPLFMYFFYYETIVSCVLVRGIAQQTLKRFSKSIDQSAQLNKIELFVYLIIDAALLAYLKYVCEFKNNLIGFFMIPHLFFKLNNYFLINVSFCGVCLFKNDFTTVSSTANDNNNPVAVDSSSSTNNNNNNNNCPKRKYFYTDCSNISISSYLNKKISIPNLYSNASSLGNNGSGGGMYTGEINKLKQTLFNNHCRLNKSNKSKSSKLLSNLCSKMLSHMSGVKDEWARVYKVRIKKRSSLHECWLDGKRDKTYQHKCSKDAHALRDETDAFWGDFCTRLNEICIRTAENVYYSFFLNRLLVPNVVDVSELHFNVHMISVVLGLFTAYFVNFIPMSYVMALKTNADHLGSWTLDDNNKGAVESTSKPTTVNKWNAAKVYFQGDRVSYMGKVYRVASRPVCSSVPGSRHFNNFYKSFSQPLRIYSLLVACQSVCYFLIVYFLIMNKRWYSIMNGMVESVANISSFYIVFRNFFFFMHAKLLEK